ncbi:E3 SUMO-protein ligase ZBED1-like [Asterias amurensis]|uniref:E3 SUMO-protein ligase ZBED1-like n=1 Tax=Asterias amurensis TaxID=7602 RepID=UPI003AB26322
MLSQLDPEVKGDSDSDGETPGPSSSSSHSRSSAPNLVLKQKTSAAVWAHFGFVPDAGGKIPANENQAICRICHREVKVRQGSTSNLYTHLKANHPAKFSSVAPGAKSKQPQPSTSQQASRQSTIQQSFSKHTKYDRKSKIWTKYTDAVTFCIAKDMLPFTTVEKEGFRHLLHTIDARYELPSRKYFSRTAIPTKYNEVRARVAEEVRHAELFSATTDLWSGENLQPYLSYTVHFVDEKWALLSRCLQTSYMPENHTGENIASAMKGTLTAWGLREEKQICLTTDNGTNMIAAAEANKWTRLSCFGHNLNLAVTNSMKNDRRIDRAVAVCKNIVAAFSHSWNRRRDPVKEQAALNLPKHCLVTEVSTRWGSRHKMIGRFLEQRTAVQRVLMANRDTSQLVPRWQDIDVLEAVQKALAPVADFTDIISAENYVTVSSIVPLMHLLSTDIMAAKEDDVQLTKDIKTRIVEYMEGKYNDETGMATHVLLLHVTTLLDPRFKGEYSSDVLLPKAIDMVCLEVVSSIDHDEQQQEREALVEMEGDDQPRPHSPDPVTPPLKKRLTLGSLFKGRGNQRQERPAEETVKLQLEGYLAMPCIDSDDNPLQWWKDHERQFPTIGRIARKYLCICATSSSSERLFSTAGNVFTPTQLSLNPEKVDMLVFLAKNL